MIDALVIGAGPSGSRTAWNLAKAGYSTTIVEEDEIIGCLLYTSDAADE